MGKKAVVLSGGGSKGAYQVGVWKALRKLYYNYQIVTGTSVGALNGVMMVQNDYRKCMKLWKNIDFEHLFIEEFPEDVNGIVGTANVYKKYASNFIKKGGIDLSRFEKLAYKLYSPIKFFHSSIDFGVVTYNLTTKKVEEVIKDDMTEKTAPQYVIASASCYPAFPKKEINGQEYIDGGYYDNLPINLAISLGATEVIAVDLKAIGVKKPVKNKDVKITYIEPRNEIVSFLVFDKQLSRKAICYGYNDTMKTFGKLEGISYTFYLNQRDKEYDKIEKLLKKEIEARIISNKDTAPIMEQLLKLSIFHKLSEDLTGIKRKKFFYELLELIGKSLEIDDTKIYKTKEFSKIALKKLKEIDDLDLNSIEEKIKSKKIRSLFGTSTILKYLFDNIKEIPKSKKKKIEYCSYALLFPKEFIAAIYLILVNQKYHIIP